MPKLTHVVTILRADGSREVKQINNKDEYKTLSAAVGGMIETIGYFTKFHGARVRAYANEEGLIYRLPVNRQATQLWRDQFKHATTLVGDVAIIQKLPKDSVTIA